MKYYVHMKLKEKLIKDGLEISKQISLSPKEINPILMKVGDEQISENEKLAKLLKRPKIKLSQLLNTEALISTYILFKFTNLLSFETI